MTMTAPRRSPIRPEADEPRPESTELREFMLVLHRALRMICAYIERRYLA